MTRFLKEIIPRGRLLKMEHSNENEYLNLIKRVLRTGEIRRSRNGDTLSTFGEKMEFSLKDNQVPVLTTKQFAWKSCLKELLWFISGDTNNKTLVDQNVGIWNKNASRDFKNSIGIQYNNPHDLGPIYGHQWRFFNADYKGCDEDYTGQGIDQLRNIITSLQDPDLKYSRRLVMSAWNPCQLNEMVLPPCHVLTHFHVNGEDELSCAVYQRSGDIGLGIPFNIASYSFLVCLLAKHCGLKPNKLVHFIGDAHIYVPHIEPLEQQMKLAAMDSPVFRINKKTSIEDYILSDFKLIDYACHPPIKMEMIA